MKTITDFNASLKSPQPPAGLSAQLTSLWYDGKGDWQNAHAQVDHLDEPESAWVHAYLHRKEGDTSNADYRYRKARQTQPNLSLDEEWEQLVIHFIN